MGKLSIFGERSVPLDNTQESGSRERVTRGFSRLPQLNRELDGRLVAACAGVQT